MIKEFSGEFELFEISVKRTMQGNKLKLVFKMEEDKTVEKKLIDLRDEWILLTVKQKLPQESIGDIVTIKDKFEMKEIKVRNSKNGNNLFFVVDQEYYKEKEINIVNLRFQDVVVNMIQSEPDIDFNPKNEENKEIDFDLVKSK